MRTERSSRRDPTADQSMRIACRPHRNDEQEKFAVEKIGGSKRLAHDGGTLCETDAQARYAAKP